MSKRNCLHALASSKSLIYYLHAAGHWYVNDTIRPSRPMSINNLCGTCTLSSMARRHYVITVNCCYFNLCIKHGIAGMCIIRDNHMCREGRCALMTSYTLFKHLLATCWLMCVSVLILSEVSYMHVMYIPNLRVCFFALLF
jgi:hypothetical protein